MNAVTPLRMSSDEFLAWVEGQPDRPRYELVDGEIVKMAPERAGHVHTKAMVWLALRNALRASGLVGQVLGDGIGVRFDRDTLYQPDALVRLGPAVSSNTSIVDDPVIVVEVVSPSTQSVDTGAKLAGYFQLPSVRHYLIVNGDSRRVIHHRRDDEGAITTDIVSAGSTDLEPPGLTIEIDDVFSD